MVPRRAAGALQHGLQQHVAAGDAVLACGVWLMPSTHGMKIIAAGTRAARWQASCPAPETISRQESPWAAAARRTAATQPRSKRSGDWCQISSRCNSRPPAAQIAAASASRAAFMAASRSSSGWRRSTLNATRPGIVLRELGCTASDPTVAHAPGRWAWPIRYQIPVLIVR